MFSAVAPRLMAETCNLGSGGNLEGFRHRINPVYSVVVL